MVLPNKQTCDAYGGNERIIKKTTGEMTTRMLITLTIK